MGHRSRCANYAAVKDVRINLRKEERATGMEQRSNDVAAMGAQIMLSKEDCASQLLVQAAWSKEETMQHCVGCTIKLSKEECGAKLLWLIILYILTSYLNCVILRYSSWRLRRRRLCWSSVVGHPKVLRRRILQKLHSFQLGITHNCIF